MSSNVEPAKSFSLKSKRGGTVGLGVSSGRVEEERKTQLESRALVNWKSWISKMALFRI